MKNHIHFILLAKAGWVEAEDLVVGDQLKMANGETIKVEANTIETLKTPKKANIKGCRID